MEVRNSVKVVLEGHAREGQAGIVQATDGKNPPKAVEVKFDIDGKVETVKGVDLVMLGTN